MNSIQSWSFKKHYKLLMRTCRKWWLRNPECRDRHQSGRQNWLHWADLKNRWRFNVRRLIAVCRRQVTRCQRVSPICRTASVDCWDWRGSRMNIWDRPLQRKRNDQKVSDFTLPYLFPVPWVHFLFFVIMLTSQNQKVNLRAFGKSNNKLQFWKNDSSKGIFSSDGLLVPKVNRLGCHFYGLSASTTLTVEWRILKQTAKYIL